jgi:hypothetical protein
MRGGQQHLSQHRQSYAEFCVNPNTLLTQFGYSFSIRTCSA